MSDAPALISEKKLSTPASKGFQVWTHPQAVGHTFENISNFSQCKQDRSLVLHNDWRNGSLRTLSLGFCPKEGFDLIYTLAIKVIYFLDSGNCCVDSERRWHLVLLVQDKCDSKRLKTEILDQGKHFTWHSQAACWRVDHKDCFPFSKYTRWLDILGTFAIPRSFAISVKRGAFTCCVPLFPNLFDVPLFPTIFLLLFVFPLPNFPCFLVPPKPLGDPL